MAVCLIWHGLQDAGGFYSAVEDRWWRPAAATDGGHNQDIRSGGNRTPEASGIANIFVSHENAYVLAHFSLFGCEAIPETGVSPPQCSQGLCQSGRRLLNRDSAAPSAEFAQWPGNMKGHRHDYFLFLREWLDV